MTAYTKRLAAVRTDPAGSGRLQALRLALRWWRSPIWLFALFTGAKSFADNPILGSPWLNRRGLHVARLRAAHAIGRWRRSRLKHRVPLDLRQQFDRDGFMVIRDILPAEDFRKIRRSVLDTPLPSRIQLQGDTFTRRVAIGVDLRRRIPALDSLLRSDLWRGLMAYAASSRSEPLYYIQTISARAADGPPDPQLELHSDTFHPSLKAWLFLTDVDEGGCPLTYVAGSHRLSPARLQWELRKSVQVTHTGDRLSRRGSFRIDASELPQLGLPPPTRFCVPANTLVVADTCGFHSRAESRGSAVRVELWAYSRPSPFLPWTGPGLRSLPPIARRQAVLLQKLVDLLDRWGVLRQHWRAAGRLRPLDG